MNTYFITYLTHPNVDPEHADPVGRVTVEANSSNEAGRIALSLPLPANADNQEVHVSPCNLNEDAGPFYLETPLQPVPWART